jgi:hypothetical protein
VPPSAPSINLAGNTVIYTTQSQVNIGYPEISPIQPSSSAGVAELPYLPKTSISGSHRPDYVSSAPLPPQSTPGAGTSADGASNYPTHHSQPVRPMGTELPQRVTTFAPTTYATDDVHITGNPDEDHLTFEVPSGSRGRLRVSLAWLRDNTAGVIDRSRRRLSTDPSPVPPKPTRPSLPSFREDTHSHHRSQRGPRDVNTIQETENVSLHSSQRDNRQLTPFQNPSPLAETSFRQSVANLFGGGRPQAYPSVNFAPYPQYINPQQLYSAVASPVSQAFAYPQPVGMTPWSSQPSLLHPISAARLPPSPMRAPSIEPPSTRGSPNPYPRSLPPSQGIMGGIYPQPLPPAPLPGQSYPYTSTTIRPVVYEPYMQQRRPTWQRLTGWGRVVGEYPYDENAMNRGAGAGATSRIGRWRREVPLGRAPTMAPVEFRDRSGRQRSGMLGGMFGSSRPYVVSGTEDLSGNERARRAEAVGGVRPVPNRWTQARATARPSGVMDRIFRQSRRSNREGDHGVEEGRKRKIPTIPKDDAGGVAREREKEQMRRMKAERRDARDARRSRSAATRSGDDLPGTAVRNEGRRPGTGRSEGMVKDWITNFGRPQRPTTGPEGKGKLWKQRASGSKSTTGQGGVRGMWNGFLGIK